MLIEFTAPLTESAEGSLTAKLVPFGVDVAYRGGTVSFSKGALLYPDAVPLTVDHGDGVLDRVGVMVRHFETDDGAYGEFTLADTSTGGDLRELLKIGAVSDVSIGVEYDEGDDARHVDMTGRLDHVSVVTHGRFSKTDDGAKVLSVHNDEEATVADDKEAAPAVAAFDDETRDAFKAEIRDEVRAEMKTEILRVEEDWKATRVVDEPPLFSGVHDFLVTKKEAGEGDKAALDTMAKFALAADTTTTSAGVVPDFLSQEVLQILNDSRPFLNNIAQDPIGTAGMTVSYPTVNTRATVAAQATENLEVSSTAMAIGVTTEDLITYAGANRVSNQLITRSQPSFVDILLGTLASDYSRVTEAASVLTAVTAAGDTAILADLGADAAATFAAFQLANSVIITGVRAPADTVWLASDRWAQLNSLVDTDGRPLLVFGANGPMNAQGQSQFNTMVAQYHGWTVRLDVDAATGTCLIGNSASAANLEGSPATLSALQVDTISTEIGIWNLQAAVIKFGDGFYTLTLA